MSARPQRHEANSHDHAAQELRAFPGGNSPPRGVAWLALVRSAVDQEDAWRLAEQLVLHKDFPLVAARQADLQRNAGLSQQGVVRARIALEAAGLLRRPAIGFYLCTLASDEPAHRRRRIRRSLVFWQRAVFKLDAHQCVDCSAQEELEAHHIYPQAVWPERALDRRNGVTLCRVCHVRLRGAELEHVARFEQIVEARHG